MRVWFLNFWTDSPETNSSANILLQFLIKANYVHKKVWFQEIALFSQEPIYRLLIEPTF